MGMHLERLWLAVIAAFLAFCLGYLLAPTFPHYGLLLATAAFIMGLWAKTTRVAVRAFVPFPLLAIAGIHIVWWPVGALAALAGAVAAPGRTPARRWIWAALDAVAFSGGLFLLATWLGETTRAIVTWGVLAAALLLIGHSVESD